ncbi:MAG: hypothetical protein AB4352_23270 [Hormoscilla sp.]
MTKSRSLKGKGSALIAQKDLLWAIEGSSLGDRRIFSHSVGRSFLIRNS